MGVNVPEFENRLLKRTANLIFIVIEAKSAASG